MKRRSEIFPPITFLRALIISALLSPPFTACTTSFEGGPVPVGVLNVRSPGVEQADVDHLPEVGVRQPISLVSPTGAVRCSLTEGAEAGSLIARLQRGRPIERLLPNLLLQLSAEEIAAPPPEARVRRAEAGDLLFYERGSEQRLLLLERAAPWLAPYSHLFASCEVDRVLRMLLRQPVSVGNQPLNTLELRLELPDTGE